MRQLLVINPNTSAHVSALLQQHVQAAAGLHVAVRTVTARFGAPYIPCHASYALAAAPRGRCAIAAGGRRGGPMLQRLAQALGQTDALAGIHTVAATGAQLAADPVAAHALLAPACRDA